MLHLLALVLLNCLLIRYFSIGFAVIFQKIENINGNRDLLAMLDSLRLELQVKDSRLQDMQDYMDTLVSGNIVDLTFVNLRYHV